MIKKRKNKLSYIRASCKVLIPSPEVYETSDQDLVFLKDLNDKIAQKGVTASFSQAQFEKVIEKWENEVNKQDIFPYIKLQSKVLDFIDPTLKDYLLDIYNVTQVFQICYKYFQYWKGLREIFKRPILRKYWKVINKDDSNPNTAFRSRENQKMKTRRAQKGNEPENLEKVSLN